MTSRARLPASATDRWLLAQRHRETLVASTSSARSVFSSLRKRRADWMANPAATSAITRNDVAKYESTRLAPPRPASTSASSLLLATKLSMVVAIEP